MKKQRSYGEDLDAVNEKGVCKEWGRRDQEGTKIRSLKVLEGDSDRSSHRRGFAKVENGRKGFSYERSVDEDRERSRKRFDHDLDSFERSGDCYGGSSSSRRKEHGDSRDSSRADRKGFDRVETGRQGRDISGFRDSVDSPKISPRKVYSGRDRIHRSDSSSVLRREFYEPPMIIAKGFRSERDRSKRDESVKFHVGGEVEWSYGSEEPCVSAWRRATSKETDEDVHSQSRFVRSGRGNRVGSDDRGNGGSVNCSVRSPQESREIGKSPPCSKDSGEQSKSIELRNIEEENGQSSTSEMEEGELEPEPEVEFKPASELQTWPEMNARNCRPEEPDFETEQMVVLEASQDNEMASSPEGRLESYGETEKKEVGSDEKQEGEALDAMVEFSEVKESGECLDHQDEARDESEGRAKESTGIAGKDDLLKEEHPSSPNFETCSKMELGTPDNNNAPSVGADATSNSPDLMQPMSSIPKELIESPANQEPPVEGKRKFGKVIDLEMEAEGTDMLDSNRQHEEGNNKPELILRFMTDKLNFKCRSSPPQVTGKNDDDSRSYLEVLHKEGGEIVKDKGKTLALSVSDEKGPAENSCWMERDLLADRDQHRSYVGEVNGIGAMEGPSNRSFELFLGTGFEARLVKVGLSADKHKEKKLKMEPLELSLGLPDVSLTLASHDPIPAPNSPIRARSKHSVPTTFDTRTSSNGFTASISFSGSQPFVHNPSCSLTQNSFENLENSVGSHPIFQGIDQLSQVTWQGQPSNEHILSGSNGILERFKQQKEVPLYQRMLQNGSGVLHGSQASQGILASNNRAHALNFRDSSGFERIMGSVSLQGKISVMQGQQACVLDGSIGIPNGLDQQASLPRDFAEQQRIEFRSSPTHSVGSRETRSEHRRQHHKDKKQPREKNSGILFGCSQRESEKHVLRTFGVPERIITEIVSEPISVMARRLQEMTEQSITYLKENVSEMITNENRNKKLCALQETLRRRSDLTLESLLKSHRAQLEIFVALKSGHQDFLCQTSYIPSSDLAEIFLNLKCRNLACRSSLPVDECDCKVCSQKDGFCSACMCLVCSKFDMASNTCSWVGCDVCLHWCHMDCGLRESHIRNGRSVTGAQGMTEMQFHCVACNHPSEMFGFVKEVFKTCAKDWKAETLSKELEYVRRIFRGSNDIRGKQLHHMVDQMLAKLENKSNLAEVYNCVMAFLTGSDSNFGEAASTYGVSEPFYKTQEEGSNGVVSPIQESTYRLPSVSAEKVPRLENGGVLPHLDWEQVVRRTEDHELQLGTEKKPIVDELESIVRIKQAEAKMFQTRADGARKEAEGLKRIAIANNKKIEEEYASRITKLRLAEAEERRRQKLEELQVLERANHEYFNMKMRMEADIKDLMLKMETTRRNLSA